MQGNDLGLRRHSALDSPDDRPVGRALGGHGHKVILAPQTIDQLTFSWTQHLLGERGEMPENPQQIRALLEGGLYVSGADRRINLQDAVGEFFNPHLAYLENADHIALSKRAIIALDAGIGKKHFHRNARPIS